MSAAEERRRARRLGRFGSGRAGNLHGGEADGRRGGPSRRDLILAGGDELADEVDLEQFTIKVCPCAAAGYKAVWCCFGGQHVLPVTLVCSRHQFFKYGPAAEADIVQLQGTCQRLEKSYFRLTSAPDPAEVRPEAVLGAALDRLLRLVRAGQEKYLYLLDQFKVRIGTWHIADGSPVKVRDTTVILHQTWPHQAGCMAALPTALPA